MREHPTDDGEFEASMDPVSRDRYFASESPTGQQPTPPDDALERARLSLKRTFNRQLPLQTETSYFILVNVLDIVMTNILLNRGAMESNPLANYIFMRWGFNAMIAFKMLLVAFICVLAQVIARHSMFHARFVLIAGSAIVGAVVVYSALLGFHWLS